MKIQLDLDKKTIKVEDKVNLKEFINALKKMFPNNEWQEFSLEANVQINWGNPIVINPYKPYDIWRNPWYSATNQISGELYRSAQFEENYNDTPSKNYSLATSGVYNIEIESEN